MTSMKLLLEGRYPRFRGDNAAAAVLDVVGMRSHSENIHQSTNLGGMLVTWMG